MLCKNIPLNKTAYVETYILNNTKEYNVGKKKPLVLVIPGGGFTFTSDREAEPIALRFNAIGCHAAILWYTFMDQVMNVPRNGLIECMQAVAYFRAHADEYLIDPKNIIVCGFSAGGNIALNAATQWQEAWLDAPTNTTPEQRRVDLCIDCYGGVQFNAAKPGERQGFATELLMTPMTVNERWFGVDDPTLEQVKAMNPIYHIDPNYCPPMFIWHTGEDQLVPVEQALDLATALCKAKVPFELVIYEKGEHGLANADRTTARKDSHFNRHVGKWFDQCAEWLAPYIDYPENLYGLQAKGVPTSGVRD